MSRVFNFSAGPAVLPEEVLEICAEEMKEYGSSGMSVMEMSHRSKDFEEIIQTAEKDLRELMGIPSNYRVLFLQGGGYSGGSAAGCCPPSAKCSWSSAPRSSSRPCAGSRS